MKNSNNIHFEKYKVLLTEIDRHSAILEDLHFKHMQCRNGCALCCIDFSVFPVEFYFILNELNFTEFDFNEFTDENTLPQDKYNSKLFLINREFIAEFTDKKYNETDLIPLKEIGKQLFNTEK